MNSLSLVVITGSRGVPTETTADYLAHDLVHHKDQEGAQEGDNSWLKSAQDHALWESWHDEFVQRQQLMSCTPDVGGP